VVIGERKNKITWNGGGGGLCRGWSGKKGGLKKKRGIKRPLLLVNRGGGLQKGTKNGEVPKEK